MGKGSKRRPGNDDAFREGHERVFGDRELKVWKPDDEPAKADRMLYIDRDEFLGMLSQPPRQGVTLLGKKEGKQ